MRENTRVGKHWLESRHLKRECGAFVNARELTREKKVDMGENLSPHEGTQMTSTVIISSWCFLFCFVLFCFVLNSMRTGLYSSEAVGVIRKNTEFL